MNILIFRDNVNFGKISEKWEFANNLNVICESNNFILENTCNNIIYFLAPILILKLKANE